MPNAPDARNYTLGRGKCYFDKLDQTNSVYEGERDLGNATAVTCNTALDTLDHYTSRSGLKAKDKKVVLQITPTIAFTLDEISWENISLMFMADYTDVSQSADDELSFLLDVSTYKDSQLTGNRYYSVGDYRNIGVYKLSWDGGGGGVPTRGETITGGTSSATAEILNVMAGSTAASGTAYVKDISGTFQDDEAVTTATLTSGNLNVPTTHTYFDATSGLIFDTTDVCISDDATNAVVAAQTTDYVVDSTSGRVLIVDGGSLDGITADYDVEFAVQALSYKKIQGFNESSIEGKFRFVPDNPVGNNMELLVHRLDLTPEGDIGLISDDWQTLSFTGEILKDETNNPTSPYLNIITTDA